VPWIGVWMLPAVTIIRIVTFPTVFDTDGVTKKLPVVGVLMTFVADVMFAVEHDVLSADAGDDASTAYWIRALLPLPKKVYSRQAGDPSCEYSKILSLLDADVTILLVRIVFAMIFIACCESSKAFCVFFVVRLALTKLANIAVTATMAMEKTNSATMISSNVKPRLGSSQAFLFFCRCFLRLIIFDAYKYYQFFANVICAQVHFVLTLHVVLQSAAATIKAVGAVLFQVTYAVTTLLPPTVAIFTRLKNFVAPNPAVWTKPVPTL